MTRLGSLAVLALAVLLAADGPSVPADGVDRAEVVVLLSSPPLARAAGSSDAIAREQAAFARHLRSHVPDAEIGWRYRLVANGFSVLLPRSDVARLRALPGVREVLAAASYEPQLTSSPQEIGAPTLWGQALDTAGQGVKIGIIDSGIDPSHPYFDPAGYAMPAGFPKGQQRFTSAKIIVARVFAPNAAPVPNARVAFANDDSSHGTHVAGIAAGNAGTSAGGSRVAGVAPRAYLGNYKVFVRTSSGLSPNANSPAIVAAIEAAVADGMDVINFSGGEPEIEPSRDIVARALDAAAAAGVVPVVAAGNDYNDLGAGSVSSPANSARAIAVGAVDVDGSSRTHADFSSVGPTTISLRLKPDVAAPGVDVLSSVPGGGFTEFSGTSMASPHVAGAAALLRQRHPAWTVDQLKSALVQSGVDATAGRGAAGPSFQGGGVVALTRADQPLVFATPSSLSLGLVGGRSAPEELRELRVQLLDAGGGTGVWRAAIEPSSKAPGVTLALRATEVAVPGEVVLAVRVAGAPRAGEFSGYVVLRRGSDVRRIPYWGRRTPQSLARHPLAELARPGVYRSTTAGRPSLVTRYRYPDAPSGIGVATFLRGPERVFRFRITRRVANAGVVVTQLGTGSAVEPRIVAGLDENRLTGYAGLPVNHNPYLDEFREPVRAAAVLSPARGDYAVVFDSAGRAGAGAFRFRFWVDDTSPPTLRLRTKRVSGGRAVLVSAVDAGAGVYPESIRVTVDDSRVRWRLRGGLLSIPTRGLAAGSHRLRVRVSDFQEAKNTENVARILPNTRWLTATFTVR